MGFPEGKTLLAHYFPCRKGLDRTFLNCQLHGWKDLEQSLRRHGAVDELEDEGSTSLARDVALGLHPLVVARHAATTRDGRKDAVAAIANARAARQELPFQGPNGRFWRYPLKIFGRD
jgi:hypothetical protein|tara:strand:+ start:12072 stop:12425 length:354 start_codon:yes stop_codon:yes gene_type:complete